VPFHVNLYTPPPPPRRPAPRPFDPLNFLAQNRQWSSSRTPQSGFHVAGCTFLYLITRTTRRVDLEVLSPPLVDTSSPRLFHFKVAGLSAASLVQAPFISFTTSYAVSPSKSSYVARGDLSRFPLNPIRKLV